MVGKQARKARRRARKPVESSTVTLVNPVSDHFASFIVGNALVWQVRALIEMQAEMEPDAYEALVREFESYKAGTAFASSRTVHDALVDVGARYFVQEGSAKGQTLVLCGAGPTLREHAAEYCPKADQVWGCNSAAMWLYNHGHRVTHAFTVDQTAHMAEEWKDAPDLEYLVATTVHPDLMDLLAGQRFKFFHNFVGIRERPVAWEDFDGTTKELGYEDWLYTALFPSTCRSGSGLNSVTRAIDVAHFMGFDKIYVLGADCSLQYTGMPPADKDPKHAGYLEWLRTNTVMHADGGHALASEATPITMHGEIDGRTWLTKPDMAISAQWLVKMAQKNPGRLVLVGDTLPNAMLHAKTFRTIHGETIPADLTRLPNFVDHEGNLANIPV